MISIDEVSAAVLSDSSPIKRNMPRPVEHRLPGYEEQFDSKTVFCDAFAQGRGIILSGPALLNLLDVAKITDFRLNGVIPLKSEISDLWKTQRSRLVLPAKSKPWLAARKALLKVSPARVTFTFGREKFSLKVQPSGRERFRGRRVLYTLQKDNRLEWIQDWINYYVKIHGIDSVIIYDNGSTAYTIDELRDAVDSVDGLEEGVVLSWPFPYGPGAPRVDLWDSDFCQYTAMEHMRWRYTAESAGVINADIDELIVCDDDRTVFDHLEASENGAVFYSSYWVESVSSRKIEDDRQFGDFVYLSKARDMGTKKWTAKPSKLPVRSQVGVHSIREMGPNPGNEHIMHRHFLPMNTDWKRKRAEVVPVDPEIHHVDEPLVAAMRKAFGTVREIDG